MIPNNDYDIQLRYDAQSEAWIATISLRAELPVYMCAFDYEYSQQLHLWATLAQAKHGQIMVELHQHPYQSSWKFSYDQLLGLLEQAKHLLLNKT